MRLPDDWFLARRAIPRWKNALRVLRSMSKHDREKHFDMGTWGERTECGTVACLGGHCGLDPWFRKRGLTARFDRMGDIHFPKAFPSEFLNDELDGAALLFRFRDSHAQMVVRVKAHIAKLQKLAERAKLEARKRR